MSENNPWKGDGSPPPAEADVIDAVVMTRFREIAKLDTIEAQLNALNGDDRIAPLSVEELAKLQAVANVRKALCQQQEREHEADALRNGRRMGSA